MGYYVLIGEVYMENETLVAIGHRIYETRKKNNLTQEQLAYMAGLSVKTLSAAENGHKVMRPENIIKLCDCLSITTDYLLRGDSPRLNSDVIDGKEITHLTPKQRAALSTIIEAYLSALE